MPKRTFLRILLLSAFLTSCTQVDATPDIDSPIAIAVAVSTQLASLPTATVVPSAIPETLTSTPSPTVITIVPTQTITSTPPYPYPFITWTPSTCDFSAFLADLDIVDYSKIPPGTAFTKTWRIKNIGTCTWTTQYRFQYISGNPMGADTIYLPRAVPPGETIDLSLQMTAPDIEEDYSNFWRLRNTAGEIFGTTFYVAIEVSKGTGESTSTETQIPATPTP
jgi:hypothetical protein